MFLYQCLTFKSNFKILNETNWILIGWGTYLTMMQVATRFDVNRTTPKMLKLYCAKYRCTMYIKLLNALNKLFQLGNIA